MKKIVLLLLFLLPALAEAQRTDGSKKVGWLKNKTIHKETGKEIAPDELKVLLEENPDAVKIPVYNEYGKVEHFLYDPTTKNRRFYRDKESRPEQGELFPRFIMRTVDGKKYDSDSLREQFIVLQFLPTLRKPVFSSVSRKRVQEYERAVAEISKTYPIVPLLVIAHDKENLYDNYGIEEPTFKIVPDGIGFHQRYEIIAGSTIIIIDPEGRLMGYFEDPDSRTIVDTIKGYKNK